MRRHTRKLIPVPVALLATAALAAAPAPASAAGCAGADTPPSAGKTQARGAVLCLLNQQRARHGMRPLRGNRRLRLAASRHSVSMARRNFFSHVSPSGATMTTRIKRTGYTRNARRWSIGENIAWGTGTTATPRQIVGAWMRSPGHRANILNRSFREIGVGVAVGAPVRVHASVSGATYTTDFGLRR